MAYHAACLLVLLGTQWLGCPNFLRVAVSTPSPPATGDSNAPERPNAPSVIDALISTQRNRCSITNVSEDEVWVDCDEVSRDIESSLRSPLAAPQLEGAARSDEEGGSLATTTSVDCLQRRARARHQRSLEERQVLLAAQDGPLTSGSRAAAVLEQKERRLARDREYAARRREEQRLQEVREGRRAVTEDGAPVLLRSRTPSRSQAPRLALTSGDRLPPARASPSLPDREFPTVPRRGRRRVLEDSEDEEAALGSGRPGSSAPLPSRPASSSGYEFLFGREEAASTTVDAEVQACVDVAERGVQASVRTRNRATQSERLGVDVSTQTVCRRRPSTKEKSHSEPGHGELVEEGSTLRWKPVSLRCSDGRNGLSAALFKNQSAAKQVPLLSGDRVGGYRRPTPLVSRLGRSAKGKGSGNMTFGVGE